MQARLIWHVLAWLLPKTERFTPYVYCTVYTTEQGGLENKTRWRQSHNIVHLERNKKTPFPLTCKLVWFSMFEPGAAPEDGQDVGGLAVLTVVRLTTRHRHLCHTTILTSRYFKFSKNTSICRRPALKMIFQLCYSIMHNMFNEKAMCLGCLQKKTAIMDILVRVVVHTAYMLFL